MARNKRQPRQPAPAAGAPQPGLGARRWPLRVALVVVVGLVIYLGLDRMRAQNRLTIENRSGQQIDLLKITVGGHTSTFHNLPQGARESVALSLGGTDRLTMEGELADKTVIRWSGSPGGPATLVILPGAQVDVHLAGKR